MSASSKSVVIPVPPTLPVLWWRPWMMGLCSWLAVLLLNASPALGQTEHRRPAREGVQKDTQGTVPANESKAAPLSAKKLEEALRLLLRADSIQTSRQGRINLPGGPETTGMVVDQTVTKLGHDFYDSFYAGFEFPEGATDFLITVSERPARGNSVLIAVSINNEDLMEMPLQPRAELIEEAAAQAVAGVQGFLQDSQSVSRQLEQGERQTQETY